MSNAHDSAYDNIAIETLEPKKAQDFIANLHKIDPEAAIKLEKRYKKFHTGKTDSELEAYITEDPETERMKEDVKVLAPLAYPVLIFGETGTGKEIIARALHHERKGKWLAVNCAGFQETLLESELFGHVKGAFTGANRDKIGIFEAAKDGTVFLDEIGELPMSMQAKLLRVIQEKKIRRVGDSDEITINCRIVSATNKDLEALSDANLFRDDLYHRLSLFTIRPKPLRNRKKDIPLLVEHIDEEAKIKDIHWFCGYIDPNKLKGNVRSLQKMVYNYIVLKKLPHEK